MKFPSTLTPPQTDILHAVLTAEIRIQALKDKADLAGLPILATFLKDMAQLCEVAVEMQCRAMENKNEGLPATCHVCKHDLHGMICRHVVFSDSAGNVGVCTCNAHERCDHLKGKCMAEGTLKFGG